MGAQKLGQPVPESNLVSDVNRGVPHPTQWYVPGSLVHQYFPVNARSVPASRVTWYCSGVNCVRHSASLFEILGVVSVAILLAMKNLPYRDQHSIHWMCGAPVSHRLEFRALF